MNQLAHRTNINAPREYTPSQLDLIRRTVAKDTSPEEFDMFVEICRRQQLDPFRRQIYAFVFNKDKPAKRQFVTVTGIDGYRAIAKRTGKYRPADREPEFDVDKSLIDPDTNPFGLVKAVVTIFQFGPDGVWYPVVGIARWNEYAPLEFNDYEYVETGEVYEDTGKPKKVRRPKKDAKKVLTKDNWKTMGHSMLAKCAEAQALRKGWPEETGGIYTEDEISKVSFDMTASEEVDKFNEEERMKKVGAVSGIPFIFDYMKGIEIVPDGQIADRILAHLREMETSSEIEMWKQGNRQGLNMYWAKMKSEALQVKAEVEKLQAEKPQFINEPTA